ncbi:MAG: hypothetical protein ABI607_15925 [Betaproteobacteria bacterium]
MNDNNIDPQEFARYVRDAERMRAEALREWLFNVRGRVAVGTKWIVRRVRTLVRRRNGNLSVPAPHH